MPSNQTNFLTGTVTVTYAQNILITNLTLTTANIEYTHTLQDGLKRAIIRARGVSPIRLAFVATESGTNFFTIPAKCCLTIWDIDLSSKSLYVQSSVNGDILEVMEFF